MADSLILELADFVHQVHTGIYSEETGQPQPLQFTVQVRLAVEDRYDPDTPLEASKNYMDLKFACSDALGTTHYKLIEAVAEKSRVRQVVEQSGDAGLTLLYNKIIDHVQKFRTRHLEYAAQYINRQAQTDSSNPVEVGTGGTPFMKYLKKHRDESRASYIGDYEPMFHAPIFKSAS